MPNNQESGKSKAIGTVIALIAAGGGAVAWWAFLAPDEFALDAHLAHGSYYAIERSKDKSLRVAPQVKLYELISNTPDTTDGILNLTLDLSNRGPRAVSVNGITIAFDKIDYIEPKFLVVELADSTSGADSLAAVGLDVVESGPGWFRVRVPDGEDPQVLKQVIRQQTPVEIAALYEDSEGTTHREFSRAETVDLKISPEQKTYDIRVGHFIESRDSVEIPLRISGQKRVRGTARVSLRYNSEKTESLLEQLEIELAPAPLVEIKTSQDNG